MWAEGHLWGAGRLFSRWLSGILASFFRESPSPGRGCVLPVPSSHTQQRECLMALREGVQENPPCPGEWQKGAAQGDPPPYKWGVPSAAPCPLQPTFLQHSRLTPGSGGGTARTAGNTELITSTGFRLLRGVPASSPPPLTIPALPAPSGLQKG